MSDWLDTALNINVFAFIGLVIWLLIKPIGPIRGDDD